MNVRHVHIPAVSVTPTESAYSVFLPFSCLMPYAIRIVQLFQTPKLH